MTLAALTAAAQARSTAEQAYRSAVLASVQAHGATKTASTLGISRQAVNQLVKRATGEETVMRARLTVLDARWDRFVDALAARDEVPKAYARREQAYRNGQAKKRAKKGLGPLRTVRQEVRDLAETLALKFLEDHAGDSRVQVVLAELDEAATLRQHLDSLLEARTF